MKVKKSGENKHIDDSVLYKVFIEAFNAIVEKMTVFEGGKLLLLY
ncbi:hypothetical protein [Clostridium algoriphilum]|nr:hypothetical protein [Clostridium algoriphilum]